MPGDMRTPGMPAHVLGEIAGGSDESRTVDMTIPLDVPGHPPRQDPRDILSCRVAGVDENEDLAKIDLDMIDFVHTSDLKFGKISYQEIDWLDEEPDFRRLVFREPVIVRKDIAESEYGYDNEWKEEELEWINFILLVNVEFGQIPESDDYDDEDMYQKSDWVRSCFREPVVVYLPTYRATTENGNFGFEIDTELEAGE